MSGRYGLDHPTWERPDCFYFATAAEARATSAVTYGPDSGHVVVGPVPDQESPMTEYFIAPDGDNEPTLWTGPADRPLPVLRRCDVAPAHRAAFWAALVAVTRLEEALS